ncbi:MAG: GNAT family N-acetyltransferase [Thioalkalivibrionaceae bacterium]
MMIGRRLRVLALRIRALWRASSGAPMSDQDASDDGFPEVPDPTETGPGQRADADSRFDLGAATAMEWAWRELFTNDFWAVVDRAARRTVEGDDERHAEASDAIRPGVVLHCDVARLDSEHTTVLDAWVRCRAREGVHVEVRDWRDEGSCVDQADASVLRGEEWRIDVLAFDGSLNRGRSMVEVADAARRDCASGTLWVVADFLCPDPELVAAQGYGAVDQVLDRIAERAGFERIASLRIGDAMNRVPPANDRLAVMAQDSDSEVAAANRMANRGETAEMADRASAPTTALDARQHADVRGGTGGRTRRASSVSPQAVACNDEIGAAGAVQERESTVGFVLTVRVYRRAPQRWEVADARRIAPDRLHDLFKRVFHAPMSDAEWEWKYGAGRGQGIVALEAGRVVAHYGGLWRRIECLGRPGWAVQVGDVMVAQDRRGVLVREGPFARCAKTFAEQYLLHCDLGFGFPNARAMKVAERLGLYAPVDRISLLRWSAPSMQTRPSRTTWDSRMWQCVDWSWDPEHERVRGRINRLWQLMRRDLRGAVCGVRDIEHLLWRYARRPGYSYQATFIRHRWTRRDLALVIWTRRGDEVEWLDYVGSPGHIKRAAEALLEHCCRADESAPRGVRDDATLTSSFSDQSTAVRSLFMWASGAVVSACVVPPRAEALTVRPPVDRSGEGAQVTGVDAAASAPEVLPLDVLIPISVWSRPQYPERVRGRWWLTGGDTDFR